MIAEGKMHFALVLALDPGDIIDSSCLLAEDYDLILEWRPVNTAAALSEAI